MLTGTQVLLVEDEAMIAMMLEDFLESFGCVVVANASRLDEALAKAAEVRVDVATLDVNLAGKLSYPVADVLRSRRIPFLFVTGYGTVGVPGHLSGIPVLGKPFVAEKLARMLKMAMAAEPAA